MPKRKSRITEWKTTKDAEELIYITRPAKVDRNAQFRKLLKNKFIKKICYVTVCRYSLTKKGKTVLKNLNELGMKMR